MKEGSSSDTEKPLRKTSRKDTWKDLFVMEEEKVEHAGTALQLMK
jgi:hypothetical protein